ncbi:ATP-binding protein [Carbonactinospora thermoautotrophica]|nr:ATP-binding protein [Carbonactinospora thermoautotrophica]
MRVRPEGMPLPGWLGPGARGGDGAALAPAPCAAWPDDGPHGVLRRRVVLVADRPEQPMSRAAKHLVWATLADWRLLHLAPDAALCAAELVSNVQEHATLAVDTHSRPGLRTAEVVLSCLPGRLLHVEVRDGDPRLPVLGPPLVWDRPAVLERLRERGRGLRIVEALTDQLAWRPLPGGGKTVSCAWRLNGFAGVAG